MLNLVNHIENIKAARYDASIAACKATILDHMCPDLEEGNPFIQEFSVQVSSFDGFGLEYLVTAAYGTDPYQQELTNVSFGWSENNLKGEPFSNEALHRVKLSIEQYWQQHLKPELCGLIPWTSFEDVPEVIREELMAYLALYLCECTTTDADAYQPSCGQMDLYVSYASKD